MVDSSRYIALRLQKERQDQDARIARQALQQRNMQTILNAGMDAAQMMQGQMAKSKQDGIANALMNRNDAPVATAVDPGIQKAVMQSRAQAGIEGSPMPHTGGMDELKLSMAMDRHKSDMMQTQLAGMRENRMQQAANDAYNFRLMNEAQDAARMTSQKTKDMVTASNAYFKNKTALEKAMADAQSRGDFDAYNSAAQDLQAAHFGTISAGVKLPELNIAPFRQPLSSEEQSAIDAAQTDFTRRADRVTKEGASSIGDWMNGKTAAEEMHDAEQRLNELKGRQVVKPVDKYQPEDDVIPLPAAQPQASNGRATIIRNKQTGQMMKWNGQSWESI